MRSSLCPDGSTPNSLLLQSWGTCHYFVLLICSVSPKSQWGPDSVLGAEGSCVQGTGPSQGLVWLLKAAWPSTWLLTSLARASEQALGWKGAQDPLGPVLCCGKGWGGSDITTFSVSPISPGWAGPACSACWGQARVGSSAPDTRLTSAPLER